MLFAKNSSGLGAVALAKARELQALIDTLNNTTVGSLINDIATNANNIATNANDITTNANNIATNANDITTNANNIATNANNIATNANAIALINVKMNSLASIFGATFNADGSINLENYSSHTHGYVDATINDTADGSGTQTNTNKTTTGVN